MITVKSSVIVNRSPMEVFDFVRDQENAVQWLNGLLSSKPTNEIEGIGYTWKDVIEMFGRPVETEFELTGFDPGRQFTFKSISGPFPVSGVYSFDPAGDGADVTFELKAEPGGFFKLAEPLLGRMMQRQWDANVANLKDIMESS